MLDLDQIVKAYDIRGLVPEQWDASVSRAFGAAFALITSANAIVVGRDMRASSPELARAFAEGAAAMGADVIDVGLCSTDQLYFASGKLNLPGAMFTASHNPAQYNGIKLCHAGAAPFGQDTGLLDLRALVAGWAGPDGQPIIPPTSAAPGTVVAQDELGAYAAHLHSLVDLRAIRPLKVVVDAGNGMGGHTVPAVFAGLSLDVVPMYFELDGTFPNHEANPLDPKNLVDLQRKVVEVGADLGLAFDGDADRCFVVDEHGQPVSPSAITALVAVRELARARAAGEESPAVIHNLITSRTVPDVIREHGGRPVRTRVGHSFIKQEMAATGAIFGGEHSAHYYFRDFWGADTGMLAAMHVLAALGAQHCPLSDLVRAYDRYSSSGEVNSTVAEQAARTAGVRAAFASTPGVEFDELDGLTVATDAWWFNLRPSNTEPLLRLNVEASSVSSMEQLRDQVLAIIRR